MPILNYQDPKLSHFETLRHEEIDHVSFNLKRMEWYTDTLAWTEYIVEMYIAKPRRRGNGKFWPANLVSIFKFQDRDKANQLFILMVEGKK